MTYRCPYCKHDMGPTLHAKCPNCKRTMLVPTRLTPGYTDRRRRKKRRVTSRKRSARKQNTTSLPDILVRRKASHILTFMAIFVLVGAMLIGRARNTTSTSTRHSPRQKTQMNLDALRMAVELFRIDSGRYPTEEEGLLALVQNPGCTNWGGPYVNFVRPDPWQRPFLYAIEGSNVTLFCSGPDKIPNTSDDIRSSDFTPEEVLELTAPPAKSQNDSQPLDMPPSL